MTRRNGLLPSIATASLLTAGFVAVWYLCCIWSFSLLHSIFPRERWSQGVVQVTKSGEIVVRQIHPNGSQRLRDLGDNELAGGVVGERGLQPAVRCAHRTGPHRVGARSVAGGNSSPSA